MKKRVRKVCFVRERGRQNEEAPGPERFRQIFSNTRRKGHKALFNRPYSYTVIFRMKHTTHNRNRQTSSVLLNYASLNVSQRIDSWDEIITTFNGDKTTITITI